MRTLFPSFAHATRPRSPARAFTLIELAVILLIALVLTAILLPAMSRARPTGSRQIKDSTQIRGIHQGMVLWAQNNNNVYPLPSTLDVHNTTVAEEGTAKDTTANIISIMIYNGFFSPELCVSPAESNRAINIFANYQYTDPPSAYGPDKGAAHWDPAFPADFAGGQKGGFSYAHLLPSGPRRTEWGSTFNAAAPIIGNRGPQVVSINKGRRDSLHPVLALPRSNTLLINGPPTSWEGNMAYNDNHVAFEPSTMPPTVTFSDSAGKPWSDCLFFDEPDDPAGTNAFLGIFTTAGDTPAAFRSIWD